MGGRAGRGGGGGASQHSVTRGLKVALWQWADELDLPGRILILFSWKQKVRKAFIPVY